MQIKKKEINYIQLYKKYSNVWLALDSDTNQVVVSGKDPGKVLEEAWKKGIKKPHMVKIPDEQRKTMSVIV